MSPKRIQRRRTPGWRKPEGAVYVGRGSRWGNPWQITKTSTGMWVAFWTPSRYTPDNPHIGAAYTIRCAYEISARQQAVKHYGEWIETQSALLTAGRRELVGRDLMCWCPLDQPCHADVLLALANPA